MVNRCGVIAWQSHTALQCHVLLALFPNAWNRLWRKESVTWKRQSVHTKWAPVQSPPCLHSTLCVRNHTTEANWLDVAAISYQPTQPGKCLLYKQFWALTCYCNNTTFPSNFQLQSKVDFGHIMIKNMLFVEFWNKLIAMSACIVYSYKNNPNHIQIKCCHNLLLCLMVMHILTPANKDLPQRDVVRTKWTR